MVKFSKRILALAIVILYLLVVLSALLSAHAEELESTELPTALDVTEGTTETNYMGLIIQAASESNYLDGEKYTDLRNQKILEQNLPYEQFTFTDFMLLSKIITNEAGSYWLTMEHRMYVGNVAFNRVASPEFPNTLLEVIEQPGQYVGKGNRAFAKLIPYIWCCEAAARLYNGERPLPKSVVFQANFTQGSGTYLVVKDPTGALRNTYFCYSSHMDLYKEE